MPDSFDMIPSYLASSGEATVPETGCSTASADTSVRPVPSDSPGDPVNASTPTIRTPSNTAPSGYAADVTDLHALAAHWAGVLIRERLHHFSTGFGATSHVTREASKRLLRVAEVLGGSALETAMIEAEDPVRDEMGEARWHAFRHGGAEAWLREQARRERRRRWEIALWDFTWGAGRVVVTAEGGQPAGVAPRAWGELVEAALRSGWLPDEEPAADREGGPVPLTGAQAADLADAMAWPVRQMTCRGGMPLALQMMRAGPVTISFARGAADDFNGPEPSCQ